MPFSPVKLIAQLRTTAIAIDALCRDVDAEQARWQPAEAEWSILLVVCHLYDEERLDFRRRLESTLRDPLAAWAPNDPPGWVTAHDYAAQSLIPRLDAFLSERAASLIWLDGLADPRWDHAYMTPFGPLSAADLLASWVAHDLLHLRQINALRYAWLRRSVAPVSPDYAGEWE
jgi:hypothetical protein